MLSSAPWRLQVVELEPTVMDAAARKRLRPLAHLPLTSEQCLVECDLSPLLPAASMAAFAEELAQREKRRDQRRRDEAKRQRADERRRRAEEAAAARQGPSVAELRAMPLPSATLLSAPGTTGVEGIAEEAGPCDLDQEQAAPASPAPPVLPGGVSFAALAKYGFGATGPSLAEAASGRGAGSDTAAPRPVALPVPQGVWASQQAAATTGSSTARAPWGSAAAAPSGGSMSEHLAEQESRPAPSAHAAKKGKKGKVLFSTVQRHY